MEIWDAYDCNGNKTGAVLTRGEPIPAGLFHMVCETMVRHRDGSYLLMQRDFDKQAYPGWLEVGASGSALRGETPPVCAKRELQEETGIAAGTVTRLYRQVNPQHQTIYFGYLCVTDCQKEHIVLQAGETVAFRWVSREQLLEFLESDACIPSQRERLRGYLHKI